MSPVLGIVAVYVLMFLGWMGATSACSIQARAFSVDSNFPEPDFLPATPESDQFPSGA